jgi:DNA repair protein RecO (recombination protein O)
MEGDWNVADAASAPTRGSASGLIAAYAQWHLERGIRSLEHVEAAT